MEKKEEKQTLERKKQEKELGDKMDKKNARECLFIIFSFFVGQPW